MDLWHELKVPNDVDLLRQLASGERFLATFVPRIDSPLRRRVTGHTLFRVGGQGTGNEEEGKERCNQTTTSSHHKYPSQGFYRSIERLCRARKVIYPCSFGTFIYPWTFQLVHYHPCNIMRKQTLTYISCFLPAFTLPSLAWGSPRVVCMKLSSFSFDTDCVHRSQCPGLNTV